MSVGIETLRSVAARREALHRNHTSSRPLSPGYELIGLLGERTFSQQFGLPMDLADRPAGDGRVDFTHGVWTIDVKTARKAYNLLREVGKDHADILVLAMSNVDETDAVLLGWEFERNMRACPTKDFGYGIINHYLHRNSLRSMLELGHMLAVWKAVT